MTFEQFIEQSEAFKHLLYVEGTRNLFMKENGVYKLQPVRLAYAVWESKQHTCIEDGEVAFCNGCLNEANQAEIDQLKAELAQAKRLNEVYKEDMAKDSEKIAELETSLKHLSESFHKSISFEYDLFDKGWNQCAKRVVDDIYRLTGIGEALRGES